MKELNIAGISWRSWKFVKMKQELLNKIGAKETNTNKNKIVKCTEEKNDLKHNKKNWWWEETSAWEDGGVCFRVCDPGALPGIKALLSAGVAEGLFVATRLAGVRTWALRLLLDGDGWTVKCHRCKKTNRNKKRQRNKLRGWHT